MRKRELEIFGEELSDVRSLDVFCLLNLHDFQDLEAQVSTVPASQSSCDLRVST